jgi:hypothetical protein
VATFSNIDPITAGTSKTLTASDGTLTGATSNPFTVNPGPAAQFIISAPTSAEAGSAVTVTVTALDKFGNTATGYTGTVKFSSSDPNAVLPSNYQFAAGDKGVHSFSVIFQNTGSQTVTVTDTVTATITGSTPPVSIFAGTPVQQGQSAGIGFWQNKNGQALINSFNGGSTATALSAWLATTFSNLYGSNAGTNNLTGQTNAQVAAFYLTLFNSTGPKLDAEVLATALNVYATTSSLGGGPAATQDGFTITAAGLGVATYNVGSNGAAFGVPNNTTLTVMQVLLEANAQAVNGVLYNGNTTLRQEALAVFDGINTAGGI